MLIKYLACLSCCVCYLPYYGICLVLLQTNFMVCQIYLAYLASNNMGVRCRARC